MPRSKKDANKPVRTRPPGKTSEARENQLISLAVDLAEKQLQEGTASAQVITHYLKLGSSSGRLEKEKMKAENKLLDAKTEAIKGAKQVEELYINAIKAMRKYQGGGQVEDADQDGSQEL